MKIEKHVNTQKNIIFMLIVGCVFGMTHIYLCQQFIDNIPMMIGRLLGYALGLAFLTFILSFIINFIVNLFRKEKIFSFRIYWGIFILIGSILTFTC